jgi:hypothetical protein
MPDADHPKRDRVHRVGDLEHEGTGAQEVEAPKFGARHSD